MKFKNTITACLLAMATTLSVGSYAATGETVPTTTPTEAPANPEVQRMMNRLEEIKAMDLENMPRSEKRKYAKEVKQIQKKMKAVGGGVYISAGALILIIVLLILLF
ncbi:MAG TPA: hypothetical protein VFE50_21150 [Cyclobacteriaceae bacterium]|nr:hypothetical protein [Cyclobacteriaceae bacterium]